MQDVSITVDFATLREWLGKSPELMKSAISNITRKVALLAERYSKLNTPVDTGRLRASISSDIRPMQATVSTHTNYARFVHDGTRYIRSQPFMTEAEHQISPQLASIVDEEIANALR